MASFPAVTRLAVATERCLNSARIPFVDEDLASTQPLRCPQGALEVTGKYATDEPVLGGICDFDCFIVRAKFQ